LKSRLSGRNLTGIHFAMEFLEKWQKHQHGDEVDYKSVWAQNRKVIIIGGGDTATDCIGTSLRQVILKFCTYLNKWNINFAKAFLCFRH